MNLLLWFACTALLSSCCCGLVTWFGSFLGFLTFVGCCGKPLWFLGLGVFGLAALGVFGD